MARENREERAERRAAERDEAREIQASFKMNLDDTFMKILQGPSRNQGQSRAGRNQFVDRDPYSMANPKGANPEHIDWEGGFLAKLGYKGKGQAQQQPQRKVASNVAARLGYGGYGDNRISLALQDRHSAKTIEAFAPVVRELNNFTFSSDDNEREEQLHEVASAVRGALKKLAIREVASNSKKMYDNMLQFFITDKGAKAVFKIADVQVVVEAEGDFNGDEIIACEQEGTDVTGHVARYNGEGFDIINDQYNIRLQVLPSTK